MKHLVASVIRTLIDYMDYMLLCAKLQSAQEVQREWPKIQHILGLVASNCPPLQTWSPPTALPYQPSCDYMGAAILWQPSCDDVGVAILQPCSRCHRSHTLTAPALLAPRWCRVNGAGTSSRYEQDQCHQRCERRLLP
ncbi:hypothetical protein QTO34_005551 [Cnephaeus nilssonii]|uniref:Uncharacterized protein n=1 Tax=Cnephaeus nilssonii TaxID=3371016 RepID=A0AA40LK14_CNENI|nr:hypothetical protein QTO34_005551 [Eptesicus nilssonii]